MGIAAANHSEWTVALRNAIHHHPAAWGERLTRRERLRSVKKHHHRLINVTRHVDMLIWSDLLEQKEWREALAPDRVDFAGKKLVRLSFHLYRSWVALASGILTFPSGKLCCITGMGFNSLNREWVCGFTASVSRFWIDCRLSSFGGGGIEGNPAFWQFGHLGRISSGQRLDWSASLCQLGAPLRGLGV